MLLLLVHFGLGSPRAQVPTATTLVVALMLDRHLAEVTDDVLHLCIAAAAALATEVIEPGDLVHQIVDDSNDNLEKDRISKMVDHPQRAKTYSDTNRVGPDDNSSHNARTTVGHEVGAVARICGIAWSGEPSKDTEQS